MISLSLAHHVCIQSGSHHPSSWAIYTSHCWIQVHLSNPQTSRMDSEDDSRGVEPGLVSMIVSEAFVFRDGMITLCTWFHHPTQSWSSLFVFVFLCLFFFFFLGVCFCVVVLCSKSLSISMDLLMVIHYVRFMDLLTKQLSEGGGGRNTHPPFSRSGWPAYRRLHLQFPFL